MKTEQMTRTIILTQISEENAIKNLTENYLNTTDWVEIELIKKTVRKSMNGVSLNFHYEFKILYRSENK